MTDRRIEELVSKLLRVGVTLAGSVVFAGGVYYLARHGSEAANYRVFHGAENVDRSVGRIVPAALGLRARSVIQLGIVLLIATPIARVAFSLVAFAMEKDRTYMIVTAIVLAILTYSLVSGAVHAG